MLDKVSSERAWHIYIHTIPLHTRIQHTKTLILISHESFTPKMLFSGPLGPRVFKLEIDSHGFRRRFFFIFHLYFYIYLCRSAFAIQAAL